MISRARPMSWHIVGTFLPGLLTTSLVRHPIGVTITLVCHIPVKSFFLYHQCDTASSSCQVPLSLSFRGLVKTAGASLSANTISRGHAVCLVNALYGGFSPVSNSKVLMMIPQWMNFCQVVEASVEILPYQ